MRCWTKKANDGHQYTTCDANQGKKSNTKSRKKRRQRRFNQFSDSAEYTRRVDVPPRTMGTRGTPQLGDDTYKMPVVSKQVNNLFASMPSLTKVVSNVASILHMNTDEEMSKVMTEQARPQINEFNVDAPQSEEVSGIEGFKDYEESDYSSDEEEEVKVARFEFEGVSYLKSADNVLYKPDGEIVGRLEGGRIDFTYGDNPDYESSEDEEVITGDIADLNEEEISDDEETPDPFQRETEDMILNSLRNNPLSDDILNFFRQ